MIRGKPAELDDLPVIANASLGHATPRFAFPIRGFGGLRADVGDPGFVIQVH